MLRLRRRLIPLVALLVLAGTAAAASAEGVSFERAGRIELISRGEITFTGEGLESSTCNITLGGSLMSGSITSTPERPGRVGQISSGTTRECQGQTTAFTWLGPSQSLFTWFFLNHPAVGWITFEIQIAAFSYLRQITGVGSCLYSGNLSGYFSSTMNPVTVTTYTVPAQTTTKVSGPGGCPLFDNYSGMFTFNAPQRLLGWLP